MKIMQYQPDAEGIMYIKNIIRPLGWGIIEHQPAFWCVIDEMGKDGVNAKVVAKKNNDKVDIDLLPNYRITLVDPESSDLWHLFEEPSKIIQSGALPFDPKGKK